MAAYADLDTSIIDELPPGRQPVTTVVLPDSRRERGYRTACRQACGRRPASLLGLPADRGIRGSRMSKQRKPVISDAVRTIYRTLTHWPRARPDERSRPERPGHACSSRTPTIDRCPGRDDRHRGWRGRAERKSDDHREWRTNGAVPAASVAWPRRPWRTKRVACVLLYRAAVRPRWQKVKTRRAHARLGRRLRMWHRRDLELRGPGELLGTRQTGLPQYRIANLVRDGADMMPKVQKASEEMLQMRTSEQADRNRRQMARECARKYSKV